MTEDASNSPTSPPESGSSESELIAIRREKLDRIRELGVDPFGSRFETSTTASALKETFADDLPVRLAGRILAIRDMGKSVFFVIGVVVGLVLAACGYYLFKQVNKVEFTKGAVADGVIVNVHGKGDAAGSSRRPAQ